MANTIKFGNGIWATKESSTLAYNDENENFKPLPFEFSRGSKATVVNKEGLIETVGNDMPRIDYLDNSKGALLLEPTRTNLFTYSEDFSDSYWSKSNVTITSNYGISPDGQNNAYKLVENTNTGEHNIKPTSVSSNIYTMSVFAKYDGRILQIASTSTGGHYANFDLLNGVIGDSGVATENITMTKVSNGWYRCSMTTTSNMNTAIINTVQSTTSAYQESYQGDGSSGVYIWGAQLEEGSYSTSLIKTNGSSATRVADECSGAGNEQVINSTEGALYFEGNFSDINSLYSAFTIGNSANTSLVRFYRANNTTLNASIFDSGTWIWNYSLTIDTTQNFKIALQWSSNIFNAFVNGVKLTGATSQNSFTLSSLSKINIGNESMAFPFYGNTKDVRVYDVALTDQELVDLTTI